MHLEEKICEGNQVKRRWDQAQTPLERLLLTGIVPQEKDQPLQDLYQRTNPYLLRKRIYQQLDQIWQQSAEQTVAPMERAMDASIARSIG
jgi:hypothetical protein